MASSFLRQVFRESVRAKKARSLPGIIRQDGFLYLYATGAPLRVSLGKRIWEQLLQISPKKIGEIDFLPAPIHIEWNSKAKKYFDVGAAPPGLIPKLSKKSRLRTDKKLLKKIENDLSLTAEIENSERRKKFTFAIISHAAAYRQLEGSILKIPCFTKRGVLIPYRCTEHLIAEGLKTLSLVPQTKGVCGIYLCQGTELWPSQPSVLGSILANFATHGSSTQAYAHSWRRIHKHLRDLKEKTAMRPYVCGHSMGGALAIQIALYSHDLIETAYAFNPAVPNQRDFDFYQCLPKKLQEKIRVSANLDDFAFWRIGAKIIGTITVFLGKRRWRYHPVTFWDCIFLIPAFVKFVKNVRHAFPAHQNVFYLYENVVYVTLSQEEIEQENIERTTRFDYLRFFPKLYDPMKTLLNFVRKMFRWSLEEQYLKNEIEILALHERDLIDTMEEGMRQAEKEKELANLTIQKEILIRQLKKS